LWDADAPLPATQVELDEKKATDKKKARSELLNDIEHGLPLTLEAVAARFRARNESSGGSAERQSLFVSDADTIPNFSTLIETVFNAAATSSASVSRPSQVSIVGAPEGTAKARRNELANGGLTAAVLMRNLLAELSMRAASSGTRAVELSDAAHGRSLALDRSDSSALEQHASELRPTRVQADAAEALANGQDVLLCAPTGSGKVCAPPPPPPYNASAYSICLLVLLTLSCRNFLILFPRFQK
jgi:superfamily II RNA helicase